MTGKAGKYTKRLVLIITSLVVILIVTWNAALTPTFTTWNEVKEMKNLALALKDAPAQITRLKQKSQMFDRMIGSTSGEIRQEYIVEVISAYIKENRKLELCNIPPVHIAVGEEYMVNTFSMELQGSFHELLNFLYQFEKKRTIGNFSAINFFLITDNRSRKKYLRLKIYIQTFTEKQS